MRHFPLVFAAIFIPSLSFGFFCPTNFSQINMGDSIDTVTKACGKPDAIDEREEKPLSPQEWNYYLTQPMGAPVNFPVQAAPSQKTTFAFDANGIVVNITVSGLGAGSTSLCGPLVQLGDNIDKVTAACGRPSFISTQDASLSDQPKVKVTEFSYMNPPSKLIFKDGKLTQKTP